MENENESNRPSRQQLAVDRTHLANERTLLAYIRTSLAMIGFGLLILRFDTSQHGDKYGLSAIALAVIVLIFGISRYSHYRKKIGSETFLIENEK